MAGSKSLIQSRHQKLYKTNREENQNCGQIDNNYIYADRNITSSSLVLTLGYGDLGQLIVDTLEAN